MWTLRLPRRALSVLAAAAMAASVLVGSPASADDPQAPARSLQVMSFNIHHGAGADGLVDLSRIAGVIRDNDVDVVGLQEVDRHFGARSDFVDQAAWLARELRMHVVYGANLDLDPVEAGQPRRQFGTAILTSAPILEWDNTLLPRYGEHEQRGLLRARVNVRGVAVQVYNTHLEHTNRPERVAQVETITRLIGAQDDSVLLFGDLNADPLAPEIQALTDHLVDTWEAAGLGDGYTYPTYDPHKRIDYVMQSGDVIARTVAVLSDPESASASDHLPVCAEVLLPGEKVGIGH
ncbi:endonuclease/exonuclease/phosphatase family protein [Micromonospora sp. R77]|uniref:endonuclease/exonuclease/phosphatase family protein n=1 Tax=Micromonospora sp. R77 TaxID=2925836 RepID=UPI001F601FDD|nr:endonuclease/exonuclease/phosphatase family protein [Micromonospora sp. R77]MCI4066208.1 endonuclease/exonuclease/phosphatase family protein [Micromonospora sp. R77]